MIHFALPMAMKLNRDVLLQMYWDGEKEPSVDCPLVDFFCDPAGTRDEVNTALVNKRRGWNAYFPMPFRKSARVELVYDGPLPPGQQALEPDAGLQLRDVSHAGQACPNRPATSTPIGIRKTCSWASATTWPWRRRARASSSAGTSRSCRPVPGDGGYPVDENEKFFIDGEKEPSVEFQGLEDSFGFSWGFPESQSQFPADRLLSVFQGGVRATGSLPRTPSVSRNRCA